jgi:SAM-dependent methyltransferase
MKICLDKIQRQNQNRFIRHGPADKPALLLRSGRGGSMHRLQRAPPGSSPFLSPILRIQPGTSMPVTGKNAEAPSQLLSYHDIAPLDWFQWRSMLWDHLPFKDRPVSWSQAAQAINASCSASAPINESDLLRTFQMLCLHYPECAANGNTGTGMRIWTRILYRQVRQLLGAAMPPFMNLGYSGRKTLELAPEDEPFRLFIQLYDLLLDGRSLAGRDVLEIGCGTGGGCSFLNRYHRPATLLGLDLLEENIDDCRLRCSSEIGFSVCDAEALDVSDCSYDVVISIESSGHYPSMQNFAREVRRVLRPGAWFLLADLRPCSEEWGERRGLPDLLRQVMAAGLKVISLRNISEGVLRSIEAQEDGRRQFLRAVGADGNLLSHLREILLTCDSVNYRLLRAGHLQYWSLACQA